MERSNSQDPNRKAGWNFGGLLIVAIVSMVPSDLFYIIHETLCRSYFLELCCWMLCYAIHTAHAANTAHLAHARETARSAHAMALSQHALLSPPPPQMNDHKNISELLDGLLRGYDNSVRPEFGGPPMVIEVDIMVRSMGPISEVDMTYSMDCYFRQSWVDRRLAYRAHAQQTLALSISMLRRIWKPDTYFYNGKQSYLHTITTPNKFVRLYQDGRVLYSSRLTIKAGCPMDLADFPMDTQRCPLKFGSFGYTTADVLYRWNKRQVAISDDMKLSQFDLIDTPAVNHSDQQEAPRVSQYSMLLVSFHLQRHMGNFLIQVYGPCILLVVLSWVSFWLNREATADRVSLGITTVLTMTFLGLEARTDLPKVSYPTALDFFVFLSFGFIFASIIQFAVVHYFTKYGSGECYFSADLSSESSSEDEQSGGRRRKNSAVTVAPQSADAAAAAANNKSADAAAKAAETELLQTETVSFVNFPTYVDSNLPSDRNVILLEVLPVSPVLESRWAWLCPRALRARQSAGTPTHVPQRQGHRLSMQGRGSFSKNTKKKTKKNTPRYNSVSKIDRASRVLFPLLFLAINLFYWVSYLSTSQRIKA